MPKVFHCRVFSAVPKCPQRCLVGEADERGERANWPCPFHGLDRLDDIEHFAAIAGNDRACLAHIGLEFFWVTHDDLSNQICGQRILSSRLVDSALSCGDARPVSDGGGNRPQAGAGNAPTCCSSSSWLISAQCSAILPSFSR